VTDPRNLGAMLRSADGAGVTGVVVPRHRSARISPTVTKTAAGAIEYLTFSDVGGVPSAIDQMNKAGVLTVGLAGESKDSLYDLDLGSVPVALIVGGEEKGLATLTRKRCARWSLSLSWGKSVRSMQAWRCPSLPSRLPASGDCMSIISSSL